MTLKTPAFWSSSNIWSYLLRPLSWFYYLGYKIHQTGRKPYKSSIPVICVGNAIAGGSGKTPTVAALTSLVKKEGLAKNPHILLRGYGGSESGPLLVERGTHRFKHVGDEALILTRYAPTIISSDRAAGAKLAEENGADMIIMDDGLQNPDLHKDISILVVDAVYGFGNQQLLPAGPLRAPLKETLNKTDITLTIGKRSDNFDVFSLDEDRPSFWAYIEPDSNPDLKKTYIGFAGIGHPDKFKKTLEKLGLNLATFIPFADHHPFNSSDMETLRHIAKKKDAQLITTEKDYIRIPESYRKYVQALPVTLYFEQQEELATFLKNRLAQA